MNRLRLYTTQGCHLCEQMEALVRALGRVAFTIERIEISEDDTLLRQYAERIPLLIDVARPDDVLEGRVEPAAVAHWLKRRDWLDSEALAAIAASPEPEPRRPVLVAARVDGRRIFGKR